MKKVLLSIALIAAAMSMTACSSNRSGTASDGEVTVQQEIAVGTSVFAEENGMLTYLDTEHCPFDGAGLKISVDKAAKTVDFVKTDLKGSETVEYYKFDLNSNTVEQYYYVSMMGTGFYYTYDLNAGEITKIEDTDRNDSTQSAKDNGRYDSANERLKEDISTLESYFSDRYGVTIEEMVTE